MVTGPGGAASSVLAELRRAARERLAAAKKEQGDGGGGGGGGGAGVGNAPPPPPLPVAAPPPPPADASRKRSRWLDDEGEDAPRAAAEDQAKAAAAAVAARHTRPPPPPPPPASAAERAMAEAAAFSAAMGTTGRPAAPSPAPVVEAVEAEAEPAPAREPTPPPPPARAPTPPPAPPPPPPPPPLPLASRPPRTWGCRSVEEFERLGRVAEGTYGVVYRARDTASGGVVALKKVKLAHPGGAHTNTGEVGFPLTALREVTTLLACDHPAIVGVSEVVVGRGGESVYLVMEWADHDLSGLAAAMPRRFSISEVKTLIHQLASGLAYLHARWVLHRDVKPANILYTHRGSLKLADFGLARAYGSPLRPYTRPVVTLYYRAPELLLGSPTYSTPIDAWSLGCVMGELLAGKGKILFEARAGRGGPAAGELAQLAAITKILGPIDEASWPGCSSLPGLQAMQYTTPGSGLRSLFPAPGGGADASTRLSDAGLDLLSGLLHYDPSRRLTAAQVLTHPWFEEFPPPAPPELMPTYPSTQAGRGGK